MQLKLPDATGEAAQTTSNKPTGFMSLPRELRHKILLQTVKLHYADIHFYFWHDDNFPDRFPDRFLDAYSKTKECTQKWGVTLQQVEQSEDFLDDVEFVLKKWKGDYAQGLKCALEMLEGPTWGFEVKQLARTDLKWD
jgi:hypothetical protein